MPEYDTDQLVRDALERYRSAAMDDLTPPGPAAARGTLRFRKRRRTIVVAAVVALAVIAGGTAAAAALRPDHRPTVPPATHVPGPSHTPSTGSSSNQGMSSASPSPAPNGRISASQLADATLDLPGWSGNNGYCAPGRYTFHDEVAAGGEYSFYLPGNDVTGKLPAVTYGDVDGDGAQETIVMLECGVQDMNGEVVAFDRDTQGHIVTLGPVAQIAIDGMPGAKLDGLRTDSDGTVEVRWSQYKVAYPASQWRQYRWNGKSFTQTGGPTSLPEAPTVSWDVTSTMSPTSTGYEGTLTATVTNDETNPNAIGYLDLDLKLPSGVEVATSDQSCYDGEAANEVVCSSPTKINPGGSWTVTLKLTSGNAHQSTDQHLSGSASLSGGCCRIDTDFGKKFTVTLPAAS